MKSGEGGLLQVCMEGVGLLFANSKVSFHFSSFSMLYISKPQILENYFKNIQKIQDEIF